MIVGLMIVLILTLAFVIRPIAMSNVLSYREANRRTERIVKRMRQHGIGINRAIQMVDEDDGRVR